jgi:capsid portal protein
MLAAAAWELEAIGWAAWEVVRQHGKVAAVYPMPAHTVRATADPNRYVQIRGGLKREFALFGTEHDEDMSEIIIFRTYTPRSPYYGLPRWISAIPAIAELTAIREYNVSWFASGGTADRVISVKAPSLAEARATAKEIQMALRDAAGRGHVSLVVATTNDAEVGVTFLAPEVGRREGQFLRRREDLVKEVLMAHGVPPYRIGWAEIGSLGGSAAREMLRAYRLGVIEPIQTILEARLNQTLFGKQGLDLRGRWRLQDLDWEETELNLEIATKGVQYGILTPNEARQVLGREIADDDALDLYYMSQALQPVTAEQRVQDAIDVVKELRDALAAVLQESS